MHKNIPTAGKTLTVVIPVYNEAGIIENVVRDFQDKVVRKIADTQFVIAEDGSTDGTKEILRRLREGIPFTLISGEARKGYTRAFKDALALCKTELVFFSDSDGQHDPSDVFSLLAEIDENDIVSGCKSPRRDPLHRVFISWGYNILIYLLFGLKMKDIDSGFKLMRKKVIDNVLPDVQILQDCVMSEFVVKAYLSGYRIKEVPVKHYPRQAGGTAIFTPGKLPVIIRGLIKGLLSIRSQYRKSKST